MKAIERMREWLQENIVKRKVIFFAVIFTAWVAPVSYTHLDVYKRQY